MPETTVERTEDLVIDPSIFGDHRISFKRILFVDGSSLILKIVKGGRRDTAGIFRYEEAAV